MTQDVTQQLLQALNAPGFKAADPVPTFVPTRSSIVTPKAAPKPKVVPKPRREVPPGTTWGDEVSDRVYVPSAPRTAPLVDAITMSEARVLKLRKKYPFNVNPWATVATLECMSHVRLAPMETMSRVLFDRTQTAKRRYVEQYAKAQVETATTTTASELTQSATSDLLSDLPATSVLGAIMASGAITLDFERNNRIHVPLGARRGAVGGSFLGENATIPIKQQTYGSTTLNRQKAAVISTFSDELFKTSTPGIVELLRDAVAQDTSGMLDEHLLSSDDAFGAIRPASPWAGTTPIPSSGDPITDLKALAQGVADGTGTWPAKPIIIMGTGNALALRMLTNGNGDAVFGDELDGQLMPFDTVIVSGHVEATHVFAMDAAQFIIALGDLEFAVRDATTLVMADDDGTAPTMDDTNAINDQGGSLHVSDAVGTLPIARVVSQFQTNGIALRTIIEVSWLIARPAVARLDGVTW